MFDVNCTGVRRIIRSLSSIVAKDLLISLRKNVEIYSYQEGVGNGRNT